MYKMIVARKAIDDLIIKFITSADNFFKDNIQKTNQYINGMEQVYRKSSSLINTLGNEIEKIHRKVR